MHERRSIDAVLGEAEVLADYYDESDVAAVRERVLVDAATPARTEGLDGAADTDPPTARTQRYPTDCEQAAHDLDLAVALVINNAGAAAALSRLVDEKDDIAPEGALVFGCLLHLARYREAAQFWWQFAAGGGCRTAAFCLCLHHRRHGEFRDADHWRTESERLAERRVPHTGTDGTATGARGAGACEGSGVPGSSGAAGASVRSRPAAGRPLLPDGVLHRLLSDCQKGGRPRLPHALEAVIHRLPVADDDEDFGEIPQPARDLTRHLAAS